MTNERKGIQQWQIDAAAAVAAFSLLVLRLAGVIPMLDSGGLDALGYASVTVLFVIVAMQGRAKENAN